MTVLVIILMFGMGPFIAASIHVVQRGNASQLVSPCSSEDTQAKEFDIILYGATGFVGELAVAYLSNNALPNKPRWAIAGRNREKLQTLFEKYRQNKETACSAMLVADTTSMTAMLSLTRRTKVIISFAGPYESNGGEEVIRAAINGCAHYVDIAGESAWKAFILRKFHKTASDRGLAIVQSAGFHSLAADFLSVAAATDMVKYTNRPPAQVMVVWTKLNGQTTGGQKISLKFELARHGNVNNPYLLTPASAEKVDMDADGFTKVQGTGKCFGWDPLLNMMLLPYANAGMDCNVIRRSMYHLFQRGIHVQEARNASFDAYHETYKLNPIRVTHPKYLDAAFAGTGPDEWLRDLGSATLSAFAYQSEGDLPFLRVSMDAFGDPASVATPKMAVGIGAALAHGGPMNGQGGYLTPGTVLPIEKLQHILKHIDGGQLVRIQHMNLTST